MSKMHVTTSKFGVISNLVPQLSKLVIHILDYYSDVNVSS